MRRMIVLADETLENFFDHEFAYSFKLSEKETEQQRSLGREIFDNLLATGAKLASSTGVSRPQLKSKLTDVSLTSSEMQATIDSIENTKLEDKKGVVNKEADEQDHQQTSEKRDDTKANQEETHSTLETEADATAKKHVIGDSDMSDDDDEDEEEDLSPDVLEEVDRLLKEYDDEDED